MAPTSTPPDLPLFDGVTVAPTGLYCGAGHAERDLTPIRKRHLQAARKWSHHLADMLATSPWWFAWTGHDMFRLSTSGL